MAIPRHKRDPEASPATIPITSSDTDLYDQCAADMRPCKIEWFWPQHMEWGTTVVIQGEKGAGKSTWLRALCAHITGGPAIVGIDRPKKAIGSILWYAGEESLAHRVLPALMAAGAVRSRCYLADAFHRDSARRLALPRDCERLVGRIKQRKARLVVLDPIFAFSDGSCELEGPTIPARRFMLELARVAEATRAVICLSRNLTKDTSRGALSAGRGSAEIGNAARSVLHLQHLPDDPTLFALAVGACNAGRPCPAITYRLADSDGYPIIERVGDSDISADDLASGEEGALDDYQRDKALLFLRAMIPDGRIDSKTVRTKAEEAMIPARTLQAAAKRLGVRHEREGTRETTVVYWSPPLEGWPPEPAPHARHAPHADTP